MCGKYDDDNFTLPPNVAVLITFGAANEAMKPTVM